MSAFFGFGIVGFVFFFFAGLLAERFWLILGGCTLSGFSILVSFLPATWAIVSTCVAGYLAFMYAGIALTAYWSKRYMWSNDGETGGVVGSIGLAPAYVLVGLIMWAGVLVWDGVTSATERR